MSEVLLILTTTEVDKPEYLILCPKCELVVDAEAVAATGDGSDGVVAAGDGSDDVVVAGDGSDGVVATGDGTDDVVAAGDGSDGANKNNKITVKK